VTSDATKQIRSGRDLFDEAGISSRVSFRPFRGFEGTSSR
jgi:hypothetical protein